MQFKNGVTSELLELEYPYSRKLLLLTVFPPTKTRPAFCDGCRHNCNLTCGREMLLVVDGPTRHSGAGRGSGFRITVKNMWTPGQKQLDAYATPLVSGFAPGLRTWFDLVLFPFGHRSISEVQH